MHTEPKHTNALTRSADPVVAPESQATSITSDWAEIVARIQAGDAAGMQLLYKYFSRGVRYMLVRQLGPQDVDDKIHDIFLVVVKAVQDGSLREPEKLLGFVRTIAQRTAAQSIGDLVRKRQRQVDLPETMEVPDRTEDPEKAAILRERANIVKVALSRLSTRDREILERFYLKEQPMEQICAEMNLTETQFRLHKSRAKARFGDIGKKQLKASVRGRVMTAVMGHCA
jgi:RNA polymerase sigma-70 factor (ECF subfamily)